MRTRTLTQILLLRTQRSFHCNQYPQRARAAEDLASWCWTDRGRSASPEPSPGAHPRKSDESGKDGARDFPLAEFSLKYQEGIQPFSPRHPSFPYNTRALAFTLAVHPLELSTALTQGHAREGSLATQNTYQGKSQRWSPPHHRPPLPSQT